MEIQILQTIRPESGIQIAPLAVNWKNDNHVTTYRNDVIINFFNFLLFFLSSLVTFPSFMSIITGSGVMTISFYKGLTKNLKIGNTPVWVLPNIWRLEQVMNTKFGTNISNKILLNAAKCQVFSFYRFWVI